MADLNKNIEQAEQVTGDASTKLLAATSILQDFGNVINTIAQSPVMSGAVFLRLSHTIRQHYISVLRDSKRLTTENAEELEKIVGKTARITQLAVVFGSFANSVASANLKLRETASLMGGFTNLNNMPGGSVTAWGSAKYMAGMRGDFLSSYNVRTVDQMQQAYQRLYGEMRREGGLSTNIKDQQEMARITGLYGSSGTDTNFASRALALRARYPGFAGTKNISSIINIQRNLANLMHNKENIGTFAGSSANAGEGISNLTNIADILLSSHQYTSYETAMKDAVKFASMSGGVNGLGIGTASEIAKAAVKPMIPGADPLVFLKAAELFGVSVPKGYSTKDPIQNAMLLQKIETASENQFFKNPSAVTTQRRALLSSITGIDADAAQQIVGIKDFGEAFKLLNPEVQDFITNMTKVNTGMTGLEQKLDYNAKQNYSIPDYRARAEQGYHNLLTSTFGNFSPVVEQSIGLGVEGAATAAQYVIPYLLNRKLMKGMSGAKDISDAVSVAGKSSETWKVLNSAGEVASAGKIGEAAGLLSKLGWVGRSLGWAGKIVGKAAWPIEAGIVGYDIYEANKEMGLANSSAGNSYLMRKKLHDLKIGKNPYNPLDILSTIEESVGVAGAGTYQALKHVLNGDGGWATDTSRAKIDLDKIKKSENDLYSKKMIDNFNKRTEMKQTWNGKDWVDQYGQKVDEDQMKDLEKASKLMVYIYNGESGQLMDKGSITQGNQQTLRILSGSSESVMQAKIG
ncbi:MAG: hypothetical protein M0R17_02325 [Candidatus Omnitrophica bacterium]|jgi:hypothetical protein|nr:hypothetical protein [Candidatus Omnitrophota bacterium]